MPGALPHYQKGPASYAVSALVAGGQLVVPTSANALTVMPCASSGALNVLGVALTTAQPFPDQSASATGYGFPTLDVSEPFDYVAVAHGIDIPVTYEAAVNFGAYLMAAATPGNVKAWDGSAPAAIIGRCTQPGGVTVAATKARAWIN